MRRENDCQAEIGLCGTRLLHAQYHWWMPENGQRQRDRPKKNWNDLDKYTRVEKRRFCTAAGHKNGLIKKVTLQRYIAQRESGGF